MLRTCLRVAAALCVVLPSAQPAAAGPQASRPIGTLIVKVVDQTGGVLPGATVTIAGQEDATQLVALTAVVSDAGVATFTTVVPGRYVLQAVFPGFETAVVRDVSVAVGENRREVVLRLNFTEQLEVQRDGQSAALDRDGPTFNTILTREMIDVLPDDPDEMAAVLLSMAPPGATIFVDGFSGGALPPKFMIKSIRVPRMDNMGAQNHGPGDFLRIEVQTQPGVGLLRGRLNTNFFDEALSAQNPFTPQKGQEQSRQGGFSIAGTLVPNRMSFSLNIGGLSEYTSPNLLAVIADGTTVAESLRRPAERSNFGLRVDYSFNPDHSLRASYDRNTSETRNQGIGGFNLPDRAFSSTSTNHVIRLAEGGPVGQRMFTDSRLQISWSSSRSQAAVEAPTTRVIGAFTSGGAQVTGGQDTFEIEAATDLDYIRGAHAWRVGILVEGGRYESNDTTNYLGTYTFPSLAAFNAGKPSNYTRRIGDPNITYSAWQTGLYLQDDWRAGRSVLVSAGLRAGFQTLASDQFNLSPRMTIGWAPFGDGGLTLRASYGYLYDWINGALYKQTQLVDGFRLRELNVVNPSYPAAPASGSTSATNKYLWSDDLTLPTGHRLVLGVERKVTPNSQASVSYTFARGRGQLRGRNLNGPVNGVRSDAQFANVVALVSDADEKAHAVNVGWNLTKLEWRRSFFSANYTWTKSETNTTGAFALPANGDNLETEWGPSAPSHRLVGSINLRVFVRGNGSGLGLNLNAGAQSGAPYNITTGHDDNLDGLFSDRPVGVARNSARTTGAFALNGSLNYAWRFGAPRQLPDGSVQAIPRYVIVWALNFQNLTNRENYIGYTGVMTSPFFGQPTNVANPRQVRLSVRFDF